MAVDDRANRILIKSPPRGCGQITRVSWGPADQSIMVIECRAEGRPDRLLVIKLDGTVVRELKTGLPRVEDSMISPDGRTVANWGHDSTGRPNGGSIDTLPMDGSSGPVQLTTARLAASSGRPSELMIISNRDATGKPGGTYDVCMFDVDAGEAEPFGLPADVVFTTVWSYGRLARPQPMLA